MIQQYLITFLSVIVVDMIYLIPVSPWMIADIQKDQMTFKILPSTICYFIIALCILLFVHPKLTYEDLYIRTIKYGGITGVILYALFELFKPTPFKRAGLTLGIIELLWGFISTSLASALSWVIIYKLNPKNYKESLSQGKTHAMKDVKQKFLQNL